MEGKVRTNLGGGFGNSTHSGDVVQTSVDAEGSGRDTKAQTDDKLARNITPHRGPVDGVVPPDDGVDKEDERANA